MGLEVLSPEIGNFLTMALAWGIVMVIIKESG